MWRCIIIFNKEQFKNLRLSELLEYSHILWKESLREYNEKNDDRYFKDKMMYRIIHCKIVADLSLDVFNDNISYFNLYHNKTYLENILYLGCLTHDIKKFDKKHCSCGSEFLKTRLTDEEFLKNYHIPLFSDEIINEVSSIIRYHKSKIYYNDNSKNFNEYNINNNIKPLIYITRVCDKLSQFAIESRFRIINESEIKKEFEKCIFKMNDKIVDEDISDNINANIIEYFVNMYCHNKILSF